MKKHLGNPHWTYADRVFALVTSLAVFALVVAWLAEQIGV